MIEIKVNDSFHNNRGKNYKFNKRFDQTLIFFVQLLQKFH
jgi:hypothetical protein